MPPRIFVYEYACASTAPVVKPSWLREGRAMLAAVLADFRQVPNVEVTTVLSDWRAAEALSVCWQLVEPCQEEATFRAAARAADYTLVIAPEMADLLATRCRWALEENSLLLGSDLAAIVLAADKLTLCRHLLEHGVPTPATELARSDTRPALPWSSVVVKPRHGAGSMATFVLEQETHWRAFAARLPRLEGGDELVIQPCVSGQAASVAFLIGPRQQLALPAAAQQLSADGRLFYLGGRIPLPEPYQARAQTLATRAVGTVPGLLGYVGVDLVLGSAADGSEDYVIEINPRLTTSYVGLRVLANANLAEAMLGIVRGEHVRGVTWKKGAVTFTADGRVTSTA
jgi:predicted ATP-grasp superfamily ATP-dependent carboligase